MSAFNLLDVAIGMVFFFLLLSLIASAIQELIAAVLQTRARFLERGVIRLLGNEQLAQKLYDHPLVRNLWGEAKKDLPSYIPSQNFALALMDLMSPGTGASNALITTPTGKHAPAPAPEPTGAALLAAVNGAPAGPLKDALVSLIEAAGKDAAMARKNIEGWYNSTMDRISGAYKRQTQYWLFGIGLAASIVINGDCILICKHLLANPVFTQSVVQAAQQYLQSANPPPAPAPQSGQNTTPPTSSPQTAPLQTPAPESQVAAAENSLQGTLSTLDSLGLPIGWNGPDSSNQFEMRGETFFPALGRNIALHWVGWLITAFALSFGAPFWFDILNKFMVVRSTVKPKEKSPEEASKD